MPHLRPRPRERDLIRLRRPGSDGALADADSGKIVAHFFRSNELVIEYFGELLDERPGVPAMSEVPGHTVPAIAN